MKKTGMARLWQLAGIQRIYVIFSGIFSVLSVAVSFVPYIAVYFIISHLVEFRGDFRPDILGKYGLIALGGAVSSMVLNLAALLLSHIAAFKVLYRLRVDFTVHLARLPLGFHTRNPSGKLRKILDENIEKLEGFIAHQLPDMIGTFAAPAVIFIMLFTLDWRFGIASLIPIALSYLILMSGLAGKAVQDKIRRYQDQLDEMNDASVEYARGMSVIKAFGQTVYSFRKFYNMIHNYTMLCMDYTMDFKNKMAGFLAVINNVYLFIVPLTIFLITPGGDYATLALMSIFYIIFSMSLPAAFTKIMYVSSKGRQIADGIERMDKVLDRNPLAEPAKAGALPESYDIVFDNVHFSYGETEALSGISFTAKQGSITALVGPSGSGKSTVAHLIPRFFDVDRGSIAIGGVDIRDMTYDQLMNCVSFVFQDLFLFRQTVAENILVGKPGASMDEIIGAAKAAMCHDFIMQLPEGYNTAVGSGIHLSGGEKQRIITARAIIKNAPVIVLDEATAFADPENEYQIQKAFETLMKDKTVIVIAHRLSSIRNADKIIVLESGKITETGTHNGLIKLNGKYGQMWDSYQSALEWRIAGGKSHA